MKEFLDHFAAILGAVTVTLLLMSVSHEYGYFWTMGRHFQTFLATSDYCSNAVLWLPLMLIVLYGYLDWDVVVGLRRYSKINRSVEGFIWLLLVVVPPVLGFFVDTSAWPYAFVGPIIILWLMYGSNIVPFADADTDALRQVHRVLVGAPAVLIILFGWGAS